MKFSLTVYEKLIELVRANPCLYDTSSHHYKDQTMNQNTWKKIATQMNIPDMSWEEWKKIWKQKRDAFQKRRREIQDLPSGSGAKQLKTLPLYEQMSFLNDHMKGRSTVSNIDMMDNNETQQVVIDHEQPSCSNADEVNDHAEIYIDVGETLTTSTLTSPTLSIEDCSQRPSNIPAVARTKSRKRASEPTLDKMMERIESRSTESMGLVKDVVSKLSETFGGIESDNFFTFLAKKMKAFSRETQEWMEDEGIRIYAEARRRESRRGMYENQATCAQITQPEQYFTCTNEDSLLNTSTYSQSII